MINHYISEHKAASEKCNKNFTKILYIEAKISFEKNQNIIYFIHSYGNQTYNRTVYLMIKSYRMV